MIIYYARPGANVTKIDKIYAKLKKKLSQREMLDLGTMIAMNAPVKQPA